MFSADLKTWAAAPFGPSLYDRGFPDIVGFLQLGGLPVPQEFDRVCSELRYEGPIFRAPPWREIYISDDERIQSWDEAIASDAAVTAAWTYYGYRLIDLPFVPISDRVRFVMEHFDANIDS
jgi:predicted ATPase